MTYYRLAVQDHQTARWSWKTTAVTSLKAVFQLLRSYSALLPQDSIRVFTSSSKEELHELLSRENNGLASGSVTAAQFLRERDLVVPERRQSTSEQSVSAQEVQPAAPVSTWAKDVWKQHAMMRAAQTAQPGATLGTASFLRESITTTGAPSSLGVSWLDQKRLELELGPAGDHDVPYHFTLPISMPQRLAWTRLLTRVQVGELLS